MIRRWLTVPALVLAASGAASAQPIDPMLSQCAETAQSYFRDHGARTEMKYNGQRVDGTHAINGRIFLETHFEDFACSYDRSGRRMVEFFAEGRVRNTRLPDAGPVGSGGTGTTRVTGVPANDVLNVRSGPGTNFRIVGALSNGDAVRMLGCQSRGNARWCEIEMITDMRARGWVNARYLMTGAAATQLPSAGGDTATERVRFPRGSTGTELTGIVPPGGSKRYVLNAKNGQFLYVRVAHRSGPRLDFQIFNPDGSLLLDMIPTDREYRGQLWQSGDHVIEVINRRGNPAEYNVIFGID